MASTTTAPAAATTRTRSAHPTSTRTAARTTTATAAFNEDGRDDDRDGLTDEDGPLPCLVDRLNPLAGSQPCGIGGYSVRITYDPSVLQFAGITNGAFLTSNNRTLEVCYQTAGADWVEFFCVAREKKNTPSTWVGPQGTGVLATVSFSALTLGDSTLDLTGSELLDVQGRPLSLTLTAGTASVVRCADVPTGNPPAYDGTIGITTDVVEELKHVGAKSTDPDWPVHQPYDVDVDGGIGVTTDIVRMLGLVGQSCTLG